MQTVAFLDGALGARSLVFGSLPPGGRDLDLLVPDDQFETLTAALAGAGFVRGRGDVWASFDTLPPDVVDVVPAQTWGLPADELRSLFAEALPLPGCRHMVRPAPHHALLVLARRVVRSGCLSKRLRQRVEAALNEDPQAFEGARDRATAWGCDGSLPLLARSYHEGGDPELLERGRAVAAELRARGRSVAGIAAGIATAFVGRPRLGAVIALSGLDGSGKSTQARLLVESLAYVDREATLQWPAIDAPSRFLSTVTRLGKGVVGAISRGSAGTDPRPRGDDGGAPADPARALRERSEALTFAWSLLYALRGACRAARMTWPHLLRGRVVVCDRYLLDSNVFLLHGYGEDRGYLVQLTLLRVLSPRPRAAYLIDVPAAVAASRQPERTVAENAERARLYRSLAAEGGVEVIDGELPVDEVAGTIAASAWGALSRKAASGGAQERIVNGESARKPGASTSPSGSGNAPTRPR